MMPSAGAVPRVAIPWNINKETTRHFAGGGNGESRTYLQALLGFCTPVQSLPYKKAALIMNESCFLYKIKCWPFSGRYKSSSKRFPMVLVADLCADLMA